MNRDCFGGDFCVWVDLAMLGKVLEIVCRFLLLSLSAETRQENETDYMQKNDFLKTLRI